MYLCICSPCLCHVCIAFVMSALPLPLSVYVDYSSWKKPMFGVYSIGFIVLAWLDRAYLGFTVGVSHLLVVTYAYRVPNVNMHVNKWGGLCYYCPGEAISEGELGFSVQLTTGNYELFECIKDMSVISFVQMWLVKVQPLLQRLI